MMRKTFVIPKQAIRRLLPMIHNNLATMNGAKIGRNRRGQLLLRDITCDHTSDGNFSVTVKWTERFAKRLRTPGFGRPIVYKYADHFKLLRFLAVSATQLETANPPPAAGR